jgi:hypothetical protein
LILSFAAWDELALARVDPLAFNYGGFSIVLALWMREGAASMK